jgi:hypothetical protein
MLRITKIFRRIFGGGTDPCPTGYALANSVSGERVTATVVEDPGSSSQRALEVSWDGGPLMRMVARPDRTAEIAVAVTAQDGRPTIEVTLPDGVLGFPSTQKGWSARSASRGLTPVRQDAQHECLIASNAVLTGGVPVQAGLYALVFPQTRLFKVQSGCGREIIVSACEETWDAVYMKLIGSVAWICVPRGIFCDPTRQLAGRSVARISR